MKTIFMPEETMKKWLEALRSGEYKQGRRFLKTEEGYCCLGVLQDVLDEKVEVGPYGQVSTLPTSGWLHSKNILFRRDDTDSSLCRNPGFSKIGRDRGWTTAACSNDKGYTFSEIADALEEVYGGPMENMTKEAP